MQIAVLGAGNIGGTLGAKWAQAGHTVRFGVRDPLKPEVQQLINSLGANASATSLTESLNSAEVVLFAIPGKTMAEVIAANAAALDGKILIDATNNIGAEVVNSFPAFQQHTPKASLYRTFNCYGWENFRDPIPSADLFYAGTDNSAAKSSIEQLISDVGLHPVYIGGVDQAGLLDGVLWLWFALSNGQKLGRKLAFKVLTE